jgi:glycine cleavage system P protein (glycine dehydrogenase) subunit 2
MKLIFDKSVESRRGIRFPACDVPEAAPLASHLLRKEPAALPEVSELDAVRHFTTLSQQNVSVDTHFYPLGSCTMKYNPKMCEQVARLPGFSNLHPLLPQLRGGGQLTQGALALLHHFDEMLQEITGMARFTMQPLAGAHGELTGIMMMAAYHKASGHRRSKILVPDSAHGTNPATAAVAGYEVVTVPSTPDGLVDLQALREMLDEEVAGMMMTCPNTLGLFEEEIMDIAKAVHEVGGLLYYDGANLNAIAGKCRPGDLGFDIVHLNLHKTFATPHGGGGPGAGPVGVSERLVKYLPVSLVTRRDDGTYALEYERPESIGYIAPFYGNFGVIVRAYAYVLSLGRDGLVEMAEQAVLNANYLMARLRDHYAIACKDVCMHEFVISAAAQAKAGCTAFDLAKALIDRGYHPPTVYFPLTVKEALMVEPTETESKETLDGFANAMIEIARMVVEDPESLHNAPTTTPLSRLNLTVADKTMDFGV